MTVFSGRIDTPEVRCDLTDTDTQTDKPNYSNPRCSCTPRVNEPERQLTNSTRHTIVHNILYMYMYITTTPWDQLLNMYMYGHPVSFFVSWIVRYICVCGFLVGGWNFLPSFLCFSMMPGMLHTIYYPLYIGKLASRCPSYCGCCLDHVVNATASLTLGVHAQWGLQYLVCASVCPLLSLWQHRLWGT